MLYFHNYRLKYRLWMFYPWKAGSNNAHCPKRPAVLFYGRAASLLLEINDLDSRENIANYKLCNCIIRGII